MQSTRPVRGGSWYGRGQEVIVRGGWRRGSLWAVLLVSCVDGVQMGREVYEVRSMCDFFLYAFGEVG